MALLDLVRRGPRNIRKRLFRDIIFIILTTALAILGARFMAREEKRNRAELDRLWREWLERRKSRKRRAGDKSSGLNTP